MNDVVRDLASRLHHAYNPHRALSSPPGKKWEDVAFAAAQSKVSDREALAAELHAVYVRDIPGQREHGWPPLADSERDRWLAVAEQVQQERGYGNP